MSRAIFLSTVLAGVLICLAASPDDAALRNAWLQAPKSAGANWTRIELLKRLVAGLDMKGMARAKVLDLLGPPGYSAEMYPVNGKMDIYRLSSANDVSLRFDYQAQNTVTAYAIDSAPCSCASCTTGAPLLPAAVLAKSGLIRPELPSATPTMSGIEKLLGRAGDLHVSHQTAGGQVWLDYAETWRVGGAPNRFLIVTGSVPLRDAPANVVSDKPAESWALVSMAPDCLPK